jgi:deazaflavin-dependent oxidoreductase (nitroreductase family)
MAKTHPRNKVQDQLMKGLVLLGVPTGNMVLLTVRGCRSGLPRSTPVMVISNGGRWIVAPYGEVGWVRNIRAAGRATIQARGKSTNVRVRELPPAEAAPVIKTHLEKYGSVAPLFDAKSGDPVDRFTTEASRHPAFEIVAG